MNLPNKLYSDTASFGKLYSIIVAIIINIIALFFIIIGIYEIIHRTKRISKTSGILSNVKCYKQDKTNLIDCSMNLNYNIYHIDQ